MFKCAATFLRRSLAGKRPVALLRFVFHVKQPGLSFHVEHGVAEVPL